VQILEPPQNLVGEELDVLLGKWLVGLDNLGKIGLHQLGDYVKLIKFFEGLRLQY